MYTKNRVLFLDNNSTSSKGVFHLRNILYSVATILFVSCMYLLVPEVVKAANDVTIKFTTAESELLDEQLQASVTTIPKNSPVIILLEDDGWAKVQYKELTGYIQAEQLVSASPQHLLVTSKNEPLVRLTDSQQSAISGKLYLNSIVEVYEIDSPQYVFVRYGHLAGYVNKYAFSKPSEKQRIVKDTTVIVRATASPSGTEIGKLPAQTEVKMLTNFLGWAFIKTDKISGYVLASSLKISETKPVPPKPSTKSKKIALTFDDGPHPKVTSQILKTLEKYDAKATFFVLGSEAKKYPKVLRQVADAGHEIGNHTYNHKKLTTLSIKNVKQQIDSTDAVIKGVIGHKATVFRPPYGAYNKTIVKQLSVPNVLWTIDTLDWKHHNPKKTLATVQKNARNGSIVLMHDIHQETADALDSILAMLQKQGYEFVTVSEILNK